MVLEKEMIATIAAAVEMEKIAKLTIGLAETQENKHRHQQQMVIVEYRRWRWSWRRMRKIT
jgi:hypothetical protein